MKKYYLCGVCFFIFLFKGTGQNSDDIMEKYFLAIGGIENWSKVNSISITGDFSLETNFLTFTTTILNNKGYRQDLAFNDNKGFIIANQNFAYQFLPFQGHVSVNTLEGESLKKYQNAMDILGSRYMNYKSNNQVSKLPNEELYNGVLCYKVELSSQSQSRILYIDKETYFLVGIIEMSNNENGELLVEKIKFSNFMLVNETLRVPFVIEKEITIGTMSFQVTLKCNEYLINSQISENLFQLNQ